MILPMRPILSSFTPSTSNFPVLLGRDPVPSVLVGSIGYINMRMHMQLIMAHANVQSEY
jgi:hypothetical protein